MSPTNMSLFIPSRIFVPTVVPPSKLSSLELAASSSNLDHLKHESIKSPLTAGSVSKSKDQLNNTVDGGSNTAKAAAVVLSGTMMFFAMFALYKTYLQREN